MKFDENTSYTLYELRLSERNLWSLLTKLYTPESVCSIEDPDGLITVIAEKDDAHYGGRTPGPMHPTTEEFVAKIKKVLEDHDYTI